MFLLLGFCNQVFVTCLCLFADETATLRTESMYIFISWTSFTRGGIEFETDTEDFVQKFRLFIAIFKFPLDKARMSKGLFVIFVILHIYVSTYNVFKIVEEFDHVN